MMNKARTILNASIVVIAVFLIHYTINSLLQNHSLLPIKLIKIHGFVLSITTIVILLSIKIYNLYSDKVGFGYLGLVLFKMIFSVIFLYPNFATKTNETKILVLNFFAVFFIYLIFEVLVLLRYISKKSSR
ncbi:MAG: hypothetical protein KFKLKKLM_00802 [Flavobacteriales bacterium]|nr:hypothetical protein [Flavobacteriales bacterium]